LADVIIEHSHLDKKTNMTTDLNPRLSQSDECKTIPYVRAGRYRDFVTKHIFKTRKGYRKWYVGTWNYL